eukprot:TRINITY_DN4218_c0_g1_i3.p1 TRINITY_DN4218_c0_g1~~TRINITY_DN4218_c0_g1_i3.p1  ORF type:complete len:237 (+),score=41.82 TRINITY_DN4218_c0_g1_i3:727-1437(+)
MIQKKKVGMAVGALVWHWGQVNREENFAAEHPVYPPLLSTFSSFQQLVDHVKSKMSVSPVVVPRVIVIGALGRVGGGAVRMAEMLGFEVTKWDVTDTVGKKGPFDEILDYDIFVNTIYLSPNLKPEERFVFLTKQSIQNKTRKLTTVVDVSCDPNNPSNPLPIYEEITDLTAPSRRLVQDPLRHLDLVSIDHFPSLVPAESSNEFTDGLLSELVNFPSTNVWKRASNIYLSHLAKY